MRLWALVASRPVKAYCKAAGTSIINWLLEPQRFETPFTRQDWQQHLTKTHTGITMRNSFLILSFALVCVLAIGCQPPSTANSDGKVDMQAHDGHGHDDHGHDHDEHGHADHDIHVEEMGPNKGHICLLYTSPSPRDQRGSRMPSSA